MPGVCHQLVSEVFPLVASEQAYEPRARNTRTGLDQTAPSCVASAAPMQSATMASTATAPVTAPKAGQAPRAQTVCQHDGVPPATNSVRCVVPTETAALAQAVMGSAPVTTAGRGSAVMHVQVASMGEYANLSVPVVMARASHCAALHSTFIRNACQFECGACGSHASCFDGFLGDGCVCDVGWKKDGGGACTLCQDGYRQHAKCHQVR